MTFSSAQLLNIYVSSEIPDARRHVVKLTSLKLYPDVDSYPQTKQWKLYSHLSIKILKTLITL